MKLSFLHLFLQNYKSLLIIPTKIARIDFNLMHGGILNR